MDVRQTAAPQQGNEPIIQNVTGLTLNKALVGRGGHKFPAQHQLAVSMCHTVALMPLHLRCRRAASAKSNDVRKHFPLTVLRCHLRLFE